MARYLVTGGAGFIGSNFLSLLLKHEYTEVICLDKFSYAGSEFNLQKLLEKPNFTVIKGDITKHEDLEAVFSKPFDYVINFAAESHVDRSILNTNIFFENNVLGTICLMNQCLKYPPKLFVQISTDEVYGSIPWPNRADEKSLLIPSNPYSASKGASDLAVLSYYKTYNLPAVIVRAVNNFGPRQYPEKFIPKVVVHALMDKRIPVYGDGLAVRTWIYVIDFCKSILAALDRGIPGEIYNIGTDHEVTNLELVKKILGYLGKSDTLIEFVSDRPGHDMRYALSFSKAHTELKWKAEYPFDLALNNTISWYRHYFDYYRKIIGVE